MKLGLFSAPFAHWSLQRVLGYAREIGCDAIELGTGGYAGNAHCDPHALLADADARARFAAEIAQHDLAVSALSCHANPLHPHQDIARAHNLDLRATLELAAALGVATVITFSGCPGDCDQAQRPNWVTCAWPEDYLTTLEWQWNERIIPYWAELGPYAAGLGVRLAVEPHPGFVVYQPDSFWRLRAAAGDNVGVNFDPSHLFWQQINPFRCIHDLSEVIFHMHAKDTWVNQRDCARKGVLDTASPETPEERSWVFRAVGMARPPEFWASLLGELHFFGYDGAVSIEHEDPWTGAEAGCRQAADVLGSILDDLEPTEPDETRGRLFSSPIQGL